MLFRQIKVKEHLQDFRGMHTHKLPYSTSPAFKKATDLVARNSSLLKSYKRRLGMHIQFQNQIHSKTHIQLKKNTFLSVLQPLILQPVSMISLCTSHNLITAWKTCKLISAVCLAGENLGVKLPFFELAFSPAFSFDNQK